MADGAAPGSVTVVDSRKRSAANSELAYPVKVSFVGEMRRKHKWPIGNPALRRGADSSHYRNTLASRSTGLILRSFCGLRDRTANGPRIRRIRGTRRKSRLPHG